MKKYATIIVLVLLSVTFIYRYNPWGSDQKPPIIVAAVPENHTQDVPVDIKSIKFVFSEKMASSISIGRVGKELPIGIPTWENTERTILTVPIKGPLPYGAAYTFVLNPDDTLQALTENFMSSPITDPAGNELAPFFFNFRIEQASAFKNLINKLALGALSDADKDGLEDELELKIGTDPNQVDTDADGLLDYDEYCKYKTNATKADSDADGKIDSDWHERREYTYTIKAICEINDPVDLEDMNDLFQDVRIIAKQTPTSHTRYEILLYPDSKPHLLPTKFPYSKRLPSIVEGYTRRGFSTNFSAQTREKVQQLILRCHSDLEVIGQIQSEMGKMRLVYEGAAFLYCRVNGGKLIITHDPLDNLKPVSRKDFQTVEQLLEGTFYGETMFRSRQYGVCDSRATLMATMLKAAGIPTRITLAIPLVYCYEGEKEELTGNLKRKTLRAGYVVPRPKSPKQTYIVNHSYNEVYVNNKWIRLDHDLNEGPIFNGNRIFLKIISFADWSEVDFTRSWSREQWFKHRPYKTIEISDADPEHASPHSVD
ncbi:MAG: Ig-like domain-containing protein [Candidatus Poribacteria bacterium]|nr:Ig-like domain-containing protein [Candidatus Poribacteria bacterium]